MATINSSPPLLKVRDLKAHFPITSGMWRRVVGYVRAVDGISFDLHEGETLGLVGESGCGKTTAGRAIIRAVEPTDGEVFYRTSDDILIEATTADRKNLQILRQQIQIIFQDPFASLNPRMTIYDIVADPMKVNHLARGSELEDRVGEMLQLVGMSPAFMRRYPHAFSGGQRQRIGIARSLVMNPRSGYSGRAGVSAGRVGPGTDSQPDAGPAGRSWSYVSIHKPRSERRPVHQPQGGGDVRGQDRGARAYGTTVHDGPGILTHRRLLSSVPVSERPDVRSLGQTLEGEVADPGKSAERVLLPPPMSIRGRDVPDY